MDSVRATVVRVKQLILRVSPDLHRRIAARAAREGKSVNAWVSELLDRSVDADLGDRQARARARAAELGILRGGRTPPISEQERRRVMEFLRPYGREIMAELEAGRDRFP
ncbi:MAG: toxin-antitoxin system HicB family antitoxin [Actinobacteria bacterium]|nr:toxin-antitoxin system HicB family antitoxin [Actinomycetota bacterium]